MAIKFTNNAFSTLAASINDSVTTISLASGTGSRFPSLGGSDHFFATLVDASNNLEIVKVTARSGDTLTVTRGQDGTSARSYTGGDRIELRPVAGLFDDFVQLTGAQTISGDKTFSGTNTFSGANTFNNTITGSITGNAGTVTNGVYTTGAQTIAGEKTFSNLLIRSGSADPYFQFGTTTTASSYGRFYRGNTTTDAGYLGTDGGGIVGTGTGTKFGIRSTDELLLISDTNVITATGSITASGDITSNSDERLKSDIRTIDNALEKVKQLRGTAYVKDGKDSIGVIAQEVEKVFPEVVLDGSDGFKSVAYGNLVGVLIEAVKELSARVEQLEGSK